MKRVLILWMLAGAFVLPDYAENSGASARRALVIANQNYQHLPQAATRANAELIASVLSQVGFQPVVQYDLTQAGMGTTIAKFVDGIQPGDFVFVYFSGYGLQVEETNYLLPVSFDPKDDSAPGQKALSVRFLLEKLDKPGAGTRMVILDASRHCPGLPDGLSAMATTNKTLIALSASPGRTAPDAPGRAANLFTEKLAKAIEEPGSTPARVLSRTQAEVNTLSQGRQMPYILQSPVDERFYFVKPPPPPPPVVIETEKKVKPGDKRENSKDTLFYVWIPDGTFKMGCIAGDKACLDDEKPQHAVKISHGFWMTSTEVTALAYEKFTERTNHPPPQKTKTNPRLMGSDFPVTEVSWTDAKDYCEWAGGRLPSEAEWEYAARGGLENKEYPWDGKFDAKLANSFSSKRKQFLELVPVRFFGSGNGYNLYDMVGNAREWVNDFYDQGYYAAPAPLVDPRGPASGLERVIKGGSFNGADKHLRISVRDHRNPAKPDNETGFRCVVTALQ